MSGPEDIISNVVLAIQNQQDEVSELSGRSGERRKRRKLKRQTVQVQ